MKLTKWIHLFRKMFATVGGPLKHQEKQRIKEKKLLARSHMRLTVLQFQNSRKPLTN